MRRRKRDPGQFDLAVLASAAEGFTGAEIEQAIVSGLFGAFAEKKDLSAGHIVAAIRETRPLCALMAERIAELREWAADRCVPAD